MSIALTFDTLKYAKRLKQAGFTEEQAEIQVEMQAEAWGELINDRLATKQDLKELEIATKQDFKDLEMATKRDIQELKLDISELERATKRDIKELEREMKNSEERLGNKISDMGHKITIKMGGMMISGVVTLGAFLALILSFWLRACSSQVLTGQPLMVRYSRKICRWATNTW